MFFLFFSPILFHSRLLLIPSSPPYSDTLIFVLCMCYLENSVFFLFFSAILFHSRLLLIPSSPPYSDTLIFVLCMCYLENSVFFLFFSAILFHSRLLLIPSSPPYSDTLIFVFCMCYLELSVFSVFLSNPVPFQVTFNSLFASLFRHPHHRVVYVLFRTQCSFYFSLQSCSIPGYI